MADTRSEGATLSGDGDNQTMHHDFESLDPMHEDERGNTELARLRRNYSRASTAHANSSLGHDSTRTEKVTSLPRKLTAGCRKFWRHQVSITVDHQTCRDHLGMFYIKLVPAAIYTFIFFYLSFLCEEIAMHILLPIFPFYLLPATIFRLV